MKWQTSWKDEHAAIEWSRAAGRWLNAQLRGWRSHADPRDRTLEPARESIARLYGFLQSREHVLLRAVRHGDCAGSDRTGGAVRDGVLRGRAPSSAGCFLRRDGHDR